MTHEPVPGANAGMTTPSHGSFRYILMYKPFRVLCAFEDASGRATLAGIVTAPGIEAAGRLDYDSEGLLLLTDDGALAHALTHPALKQPKVYLVQVEGAPDGEALSRLRSGVVIKGEPTAPAQVELLETDPILPPRQQPVQIASGGSYRWLRITLREGRKRQIRHMTAAVGYPTLRLVRVAIGPLQLGGMLPGEWRDLSPAEIAALRRAAYLTPLSPLP